MFGYFSKTKKMYSFTVKDLKSQNQKEGRKLYIIDTFTVVVVTIIIMECY